MESREIIEANKKKETNSLPNGSTFVSFFAFTLGSVSTILLFSNLAAYFREKSYPRRCMP